MLQIPKNSENYYKIQIKLNEHRTIQIDSGNFRKFPFWECYSLCKQGFFYAINPKKSQKNSENYYKIQIKSDKPRTIEINSRNLRKIN